MASTSNGPKKIAIDTNMLLSISQLKIDIFSQLKERFGNVEIFFPKNVLKELETVSKQGKSKKIHCEIAKQLLEKNNAIEFGPAEEKVDNALLEMSEKGFLIATNDKELRKKIKTVGGQIIYLKKKKFLETE